MGTICPDELEFGSSVPARMRRRLENLFFFNPRQRVWRAGIVATVEQFGSPAIIEADGRLRICVPSTDMQCLFACYPIRRSLRLLGVVLYVRTAPDLFTIAHLAVDEKYCSCGNGLAGGLGCLLIEKVRQIARAVKGVRRIQLPYHQERYLSVDAS